MPTLESQRSLFDIPRHVAYFNCAYHGPQLNEARRRLIAGVNANSHPWERTPASFFEDAETIRHLAADLFGGDVNGYAIIPSVSYGMSTAARALETQLGRGDNVLIIAEEFPSTVLTWRRIVQITGASLRVVPTPDAGSDWTTAILNHIDADTKVVSISTCHWTNGAHIDVAAIGRACRDAKCALVIDATQSLGAVPLSMIEVQPDFLIAAGYKWLLCPYGASLLYVGQQWRNARPLEEHWQARENAEDFTALTKYSDTYMPGARRFDVGEKGSRNILPGSIAALEQIKAWGIDNVAASLAITNAKIIDCLVDLGFDIPPADQRSPHMFGARLPSTFQGNLVAELKQCDIYISQRGDALRFAPYLHVTDYDVDRLLEALRGLVPRDHLLKS